MRKSELVESKRHGTLDFPIEYYYVASDNLRYVMPIHWHREFEVIRVLDGKLSAFVDNVEYKLVKGDVLLVECGCLHRGEPESCVYECVVFDVNMLRRQPNGTVDKIMSALSNSELEVYRKVFHNTQAYKTAVELFDTLKEKTKYYEFRVYGILYELFGELCFDGYFTEQKKNLHTRQTKALVDLISWLQSNFTESVNLDNLSEISGFNKKYLCRVFKEYTSKTVIEYVNELRVENACLEMKSKSITESAYDSGFNDLSYFCKVFKKQIGITPGEYKKNIKVSE